MRSVWFIAGGLSVAIGTLGIFLPLLPTVPLLLLAAFCFARSSQKAHDWLMHHPRLGPPIHDWNKNGAIRKPAKIAATCCVLASMWVSLLMGVPNWAFGLQLATLLCVMIFIWTRPNA